MSVRTKDSSQTMPRASKFQKDIYATTCFVHAATFAQHILNDIHEMTIIASMQSHSSWASELQSCCSVPAEAATDTQKRQRSTALTPLHSSCSTRRTWCERSWRIDLIMWTWRSQKVSIEIWDSFRNLCKFMYLQKAAAQQDHDQCARFGAARARKSLQRSRWVFLWRLGARKTQVTGISRKKKFVTVLE